MICGIIRGRMYASCHTFVRYRHVMDDVIDKNRGEA
jgi:hypothetical protein